MSLGEAGLTQGEYELFSLDPCSSCHGERQLRAGKMLWQGWSGRVLDLDGQEQEQWRGMRAREGQLSTEKRFPPAWRSVGSFIPYGMGHARHCAGN